MIITHFTKIKDIVDFKNMRLYYNIIEQGRGELGGSEDRPKPARTHSGLCRTCPKLGWLRQVRGQNSHSLVQSLQPD